MWCEEVDEKDRKYQNKHQLSIKLTAISIVLWLVSYEGVGFMGLTEVVCSSDFRFVPRLLRCLTVLNLKINLRLCFNLTVLNLKLNLFINGGG